MEKRRNVQLTRIIDGDTVEVLAPRGLLRREKGERIRLYGIDAPESAQKGGSESTKHLRKIIGSNKKVWARAIRDGPVRAHHRPHIRPGRTGQLVQLPDGGRGTGPLLHARQLRPGPLQTGGTGGEAQEEGTLETEKAHLPVGLPEGPQVRGREIPMEAPPSPPGSCASGPRGVAPLQQPGAGAPAPGNHLSSGTSGASGISGISRISGTSGIPGISRLPGPPGRNRGARTARSPGVGARGKTPGPLRKRGPGAGGPQGEAAPKKKKENAAMPLRKLMGKVALAITPGRAGSRASGGVLGRREDQRHGKRSGQSAARRAHPRIRRGKRPGGQATDPDPGEHTGAGVHPGTDRSSRAHEHPGAHPGTHPGESRRSRGPRTPRSPPRSLWPPPPARGPKPIRRSPRPTYADAPPRCRTRS